MRITYKDIKDKRIWLWGNGTILNRYINQLPEHLDILGVVDSDEKKWGSQIKWKSRVLSCENPSQIHNTDVVVIAIENAKVVDQIVAILNEKDIAWSHIYDIVDGAYIEKDKGDEDDVCVPNKLVKYIDCAVSIRSCNLQCSYCYLTHKGIEFNYSKKFYHTPQYIRAALSRKRLGGRALINFCGVGETLLCQELLGITEELIKEGHYVQIVTNATITYVINKYILSDMDKSHLMFKCSFHYLELKRCNLLEVFSENIRLLRDAGISVSIEITPEDGLIPYIEEIKQFSLAEFGALPHISVARDERFEDFRIYSSYDYDNYRKIWETFDSPMFSFKMDNLDSKRYQDCMAGKWSAFLNLETGELTKCVGNPRICNIYEDICKEIPFEKVGASCCMPYCFNCHAYLTMGLIPSVKAPSYYEVRNRDTLDGKSWISDEFGEFIKQRLNENENCE